MLSFAFKTAGDRRGESLGLRLSIASVLVVVSLAILAASALAPCWRAFVEARRNLADIGHLQHVLIAAGRISAERGPSNAAMSAPPEKKADALARLRQARRATDEALSGLLDPAGRPVGNRTYSTPPMLVAAAENALAHGRRSVDRAASMPPDGRIATAIAIAIKDMFGAFDVFDDTVSWEIRALGSRSPALTGRAVIAHATSQLREFGDRITAFALPSIARGEPLGARDRENIALVQGRLQELRSTIRSEVAFGPGRELEPALRKANVLFFGSGLNVFASAIATGRDTGRYLLTAEELTARYMPTLTSLEALREAYIADMVAGFARDRDAARQRLVLVGCASAFLLFLLAALLQWLRVRVLRPLLAAREIVVGLAEDEDPASDGRTDEVGELRRLFEALAVLRERLRERAVAMTELQKQAETDGLTGVWNRRSLERFGHSASTGESVRACLIIVDIDHFKQINDRHGHQVGDDVLRAVAERFRSICRPGDVLARFGGEEFAILVPGAGVAETVGMAERLAASLRERPVRSSEGRNLIEVRASFGVASGKLGHPGWNLLLGAADRALYRAKAGGRDCVRLSDSAEEALASAM